MRFGMPNARGRYVLFMDTAGATPLDEIPKLLDALARGHDVAIGWCMVQDPCGVASLEFFLAEPTMRAAVPPTDQMS